MGASPEIYRQSLLADQLLMICLPMFIVAFAIALVCHSLFPDETDYRILMALPVTREMIFGAKLLALLLFAFIFILTTNLAIGVPFSVVSTGKWATHHWPVRIAAQAVAGILASIFAVAGIAAIQGLIVVLTPRAWLRTISVATQTLLVCALVLLLPLVLRLPAQAAYLHAQPAALYLMPPIWFLGVQQVLLGSREAYVLGLAGLAVAGTMATVALVAMCYASVYRHFDRVILRSESRAEPFLVWPARLVRMDVLRGLWSPPPEYSAVRAFTLTTLRRSGLHQLVFLGIAFAGVALTTNDILGAERERAWLNAVMWAPFVLMFTAVLGLRAALLLPATGRAVWIFRVTEAEGSRSHQLAAVEHILVMYGVVLPIVITLPLLHQVFGWRDTLRSLPLLGLMGLALVEIALKRWHRIPFTCTYLPGKRPVTHTFLLLLASFNGFTFLGMGFLHTALTGDSFLPVVLVMLAACAGGFHWLRVHTAENRPLEFEDELPEAGYGGLHLNS